METNEISSTIAHLTSMNEAVTQGATTQSTIYTKPYSQPSTTAAKNSLYLTPLESVETKPLTGNSREWGDASPSVQQEVISQILYHSRDLTYFDQVVLVGIARIESGFNPDAAARSTSAAGVFQLVKFTARALNLGEGDEFNAEENIKAGITLYRQNSALISRKYPMLSDVERAELLYALHHDGPSLKYGGLEIAKRELIPRLEEISSSLQTMFY